MLATYLLALGFHVSPSILTEWLSLVPVLALELDSALSALLVRTLCGDVKTGQHESVKATGNLGEKNNSAIQVVHPTNTSLADDTAYIREKVKSAILNQLRNRGGSVQTGERGLARLIGANRSTVRRALNGLVVAGLIAAEATRNGTMLRLVA